MQKCIKRSNFRFLGLEIDIVALFVRMYFLLKYGSENLEGVNY